MVGCHGETCPLQRVPTWQMHDFDSKEPRALFLKATIRNHNVSILDRQQSSTLVSFAKANALVYIQEKGICLKKGDLVETLILPNTIMT